MNTHFDCPVLNDTMRQLIVLLYPTFASEITYALAKCPPEMSVLTLLVIYTNGLQCEKENTP